MMQPTRFVFLLAGLSLLPGLGLCERSALLPRPQKIQYGPGHLLVRELGIRLASLSPAEEDRFAASDLARRLRERTGVQVSAGAQGSGPAIVLERTGGVDPLPLPGEQPGPNSREAYDLKVTPAGVEIRGRSSAAVFYGVQTLVQLVEGQGVQASLPEVEIHDWPLLVYRGPMVDMSHGALPTEAEVERQLDFLARWKVNQYYFYNEASIELEGYPLLNPDGRFTQAAVRRIIAYGRARHIDVAPCLELYGHLHDLFRVEEYSDLAPFPHGEEFNPENPRAMDLLTDWAEQISKLFPSPFVHIGFDETWQIEKAAREQGAGATPAKLFVDQLGRVARLFQQRGKHVLAWADIMVKYPEIVAQLPPGIIAVAWYYEAQPDPEYKRWLDPLVAHSVPHIVATGVHCWNEIAPDFDTTFENIDTFVAAGRKSHALGLMNTVWTDSAQNLLRMSWPGIAYGAVVPWQSEPVNHQQFISDYARLMYPTAAAPEVAAGLEKLARSETTLQKVLGQDTMLALWGDPFAPAMLKSAGEHREDLHQARLLAEDAQTHFDRALALAGDATTLASLLFGSRLLDYAAFKFLNALEIAERWKDLGPHPTDEQLGSQLGSDITYQSHGRLTDQMDAITELKEIYRRNWLAEFTPYRLPSALGRWDAEYEFWRRIQARLQAFTRTFKEGEALPPLESVTSAP
ncbi:MAG: beta-N-acetylhexosaminidase [Terriglobia bacterium]|jgi:hypothetical protein